MPKAMVRNGRAGWYYRILEPGMLTPGDAIETIDRPHAELAFARLVEIINFRNPARSELEAMAWLDGLAEHLRRDAGRALLNPREVSSRGGGITMKRGGAIATP